MLLPSVDKAIYRCFVWYLWCFFAVFVAFFWCRGFDDNIPGLWFISFVFSVFFVFFFGEIVSIIVLLIFPRNCWCWFFRLGELCAVADPRLLLLIGCTYYPWRRPDLLCVSLVVWFFLINFQYYLLTICRCLILSSRRVLPCCWPAFASAYEMYVLFWVHA